MLTKEEKRREEKEEEKSVGDHKRRRKRERDELKWSTTDLRTSTSIEFIEKPDLLGFWIDSVIVDSASSS